MLAALPHLKDFSFRKYADVFDVNSSTAPSHVLPGSLSLSISQSPTLHWQWLRAGFMCSTNTQHVAFLKMRQYFLLSLVQRNPVTWQRHAGILPKTNQRLRSAKQAVVETEIALMGR